MYDALRSSFPGAQVDTQDGLRLSWTDSWVHVRPSGTEPIVRVIAEAPSVDAAREDPIAPPVPPQLVHANDFGGFTADGREYVVHLRGADETPMPWSLVLANPDFGSLVTADALGRWAYHCHLLYNMEAGMFREVVVA